MRPAELLREVLYPLTDMAIVIAMLFFWVVFALAKFAGLLGIWLLVITAPAYFRYLLYLLEARAGGGEPPVPSAEMFDPADNLWSLTPLVLIALVIWGGIAISAHGVIWSMLYGAMLLLLTPASLAILAITHSPLESLNPVAVLCMIRACGPAYLVVPAVVIGVTVVLFLLARIGIPDFVLDIGSSYQTVLVFTLTGAVLRFRDVATELRLEDPLERTAAQIAGDLEKERQKVASHAYGFISRGNRDGGFAHILDWIRQEDDVHDASAWFFNTMMKWESKDAALFYAQTYLAHLLHHGEDTRLLKLLSVCLHANPGWKPKSEDRVHVLALVEKYKRDDLLALLRN